VNPSDTIDSGAYRITQTKQLANCCQLIFPSLDLCCWIIKWRFIFRVSIRMYVCVYEEETL